MHEQQQLRIGVIGLGGRGGIWKLWHKPEGRSVVVAGADILPGEREKFAAEHGGPPFVTADYRELLTREDIDAIAVISPDYLHEEHVTAALEAGKHVFCEKPLSITLEGCDHILRTAEASGQRLMVGFNMRYMPMFQTMKEIAESGVLGEIRAVWVRHFVGLGSGFYYHDWHGQRANTTSLLLQKGSHDIDVIHWITGAYTQRTMAMGSLDMFGGDQPNDLTCDKCEAAEECPDFCDYERRTQCAFRSEIDVEDNQMVLMELEGGIKACYLQCHFTPDYQRNYTFIGTKGRMENSELENKVWVKTRGTVETPGLADRVYEIKPTEGGHGGADPRICRDFVAMCLDGKVPTATPLAGRMSVAVGVCAAHSMRHGGVCVEIPPFAPLGGEVGRLQPSLSGK